MKLHLFAIKKTLRLLLSVVTIFIIALNLSRSTATTVLETIVRDKVLRIITFVGPTTYFENAKGPNGFEYFLAKDFADSLGVALQITLIDDLDSLFNALGGPRGHFAGAGLTVTAKRQEFLRFSEPYNSVRQTLVYRLKAPRPKTVEDLIGGHLIVIANSSHEEHLAQLKLNYPLLEWQALRDTEMLELMQRVHDGEADFALVDSIAFDVDRSLYPKARAAFQLTGEEPVAWTFPGHGDNSLLKAANRFLKEHQTNGKLQALKTQFYDHPYEFSVGGSQLLMDRIDQRLTEFQPLFESIADQYQMDWRLLAAMAYQESHWNPLATSPTGVRGLMMLTKNTAAELNVDDRLDPEQSIRGGAQYLTNILKRLPDDIEQPDRTWFALAAYNVGMGHLEDARVLTDRASKDPDMWEDVREYLPLLLQKKYYQSVKHGFARGHEPVQYVQNIQHFKSILQWHGIQQARHKDLLENELSTTEGFSSDLVLPL